MPIPVRLRHSFAASPLKCFLPSPPAVNEFHDFPADFSFTAPGDASALPPLRVTGDGVLKEFGFEQGALLKDEV